MFTSAAPTVEVGDVVTVQGTVNDFFGQLQLASPRIERTGAGTVPAPVVVAPAEVATGGARVAALESVLVRVESVAVTDAAPAPSRMGGSAAGEFVVTGSLRVDDFYYLIDPFVANGETFDRIDGVLMFRDEASKLHPARLSALGDGELQAAARAILEEALTAERFVLLETLEFIISPWEWRQWALVDGALENPPLFQTVDAERLNRRGPDRDAFLAWVEENAAAIDARALLVPERFRAPSARVNDGVPWIPLDLEGVPAIARYPRLRQQLEMVGCPACHVTDAPFVQTLPDRSFSPFYRRELDARVEHLRALTEGRAPIPAAFGPLQYEPVLPP